VRIKPVAKIDKTTEKGRQQLDKAGKKIQEDLEGK
jgi:hypothetical protein